MKFFCTERGELRYQLKAAQQRLQAEFTPGDAVLAISKNADSPELHEFLLHWKSACIFHATITGFGGTRVEPGVSKPEETLKGLNALIQKGFPAEQIVLRIDPIVPTPRGIQTAINVIKGAPREIRRIRFSFIDGYGGIKGYLPWDSFHAPQEAQDAALSALYAEADRRTLEACGEPQLKENRGCISSRDYEILSLPIPPETRKGQRKGCMCLGNKTELLTKPRCCPNGCLYCYYALGK